MNVEGAVQTATVEVNGLEMYVEMRGRGEPLLLLHGMTGCHADWAHAGRDELEKHHRLIAPDARGHGRSTNPAGTLRHADLARDALALLSHLGIHRCKAIGMSMGGNTLLHMATLAPDRIESMVVVSATMSFGAQARAIMQQVTPESLPLSEWERLRSTHVHGDDQIQALLRAQRALADSHDDMAFSADDLSKIKAKTLIVYGDRDPLYPVEMALHMHSAIHGSALWVVPMAGHGPIFTEHAPAFARIALQFLAS